MLHDLRGLWHIWWVLPSSVTGGLQEGRIINPSLSCRHFSLSLLWLAPYFILSCNHDHGWWGSAGLVNQWVACFEVGEGGFSSSILRFAALTRGPTARSFLVSSAIEKQFRFSDSRQSHLVRRLFGITSLPSEWKSIWFGNQSGLSWRGYTSFNATPPSSTYNFSNISYCVIRWNNYFMVRSQSEVTGRPWEWLEFLQ